MLYRIIDWDDAYANGAHIARAEDYPPLWSLRAAEFRAAHPPESLGRGHLFRPAGAARGLVVFVHGGYWMKFDPSVWSHLAAGPLGAGWAVAMPAYTLAPAARIGQMTREIATAICEAATRVDGPIALTGHSAGGHLAARMVCDDGTLPDDIASRIICCLPISGLFDLRPLMRTALNDTLGMDTAEAETESPALLTPRAGIPLTAWVGGSERPEFIRQSRLIADIWAGLGAATSHVIEPGRQHFDVIDSLSHPDSALTRALISR
ncbi:alpha/beta hydrolase [Paracoccus sp. YLB-12]|uniref:Alpha/beta hydrolase n=1 Tax=Paracoccus maritimus TaxID=2933292 RepID=A0ABT2K5W9_9RHOB|nr:alpha/beta hydrolase [Paracoccus sp. YLB-12]MCT4331806.1 alpha/beta hydrolase [Paracoccus sp. YLB-12]